MYLLDTKTYKTTKIICKLIICTMCALCAYCTYDMINRLEVKSIHY